MIEGRPERMLSFDRILLILIGIGIALRLVAVLNDIPRFDGALYSTLGFNLVDRGDLVNLAGTKTYNFSMTYPGYLAIFYALFGFSIVTTKVASFICSLLALLITYWTTRDIFDRKAGITATAVLSLTSALVVVTGKNYVENIVLVFFVPTLWALIKGLKDSRYVPLAAFFAGLTYYTKTDVGLYLALGALAAFAAWRFSYLRWGMFKDGYYWVAFAVIAGMIMGRAYLISTSDISNQSLSNTISRSFDITVFAFQLLLHLLLVGGFLVYWHPELRESIRRFREESVNLILLLILSLTILAVLNATGWRLLDARILGGVSREYITIVYVPTMWLSFELLKKDETGEKGILRIIRNFWKEKRRLLAFLICLALSVLLIFVDDWLAILFFFGSFTLVFVSYHKRVMILLLAFLILSMNAVSATYRPSYVDAASGINNELHNGAAIALDRLNGSFYLSVDRVFPYFEARNVQITIYEDGSDPDYIISEKNLTYSAYCRVGVYQGISKPTILSLAKDWLLGKNIPDAFPERTLFVWGPC